MSDSPGGGDGQDEKSFDERVQEIRDEREEPLTAGAPFGTGKPVRSSPSGASVATTPPIVGGRDPELPRVILVCDDCRTYYEYDEDWQVCPQCGEELIEVDRA